MTLNTNDCNAAKYNEVQQIKTEQEQYNEGKIEGTISQQNQPNRIQWITAKNK